MERNSDLIIWAVFISFLVIATLVKWLIKRRIANRQAGTASPGEAPSLMDEMRKILEGLVEEERPEIVLEEMPPRRRPRHLKAKVVRPAPAIPKKEEPPPPAEMPRVEAPPTEVSTKIVLPKDALQRAIVLSELMAPPRAMRRHYRLF